ncbi:hypothetical protein DPMN_037281 [Dreissena polymorpha]|uniref:Uncharacterized protein n=1 Tax=Dreissena polymorpha TaxID=45954 RepID=A0A9D4MB11_DREPO|nr:hypothetical protein DPMN_037281 [Dreissena polymorpha]
MLERSPPNTKYLPMWELLAHRSPQTPHVGAFCPACASRSLGYDDDGDYVDAADGGDRVGMGMMMLSKLLNLYHPPLLEAKRGKIAYDLQKRSFLYQTRYKRR